MADGGILEGPAGAAARKVNKRLVATWLDTQRSLARRRNSKSIHAFRVALRRLRSNLRAFRAALPLPKGLRRRLRRLSRATDESRNLEVFQAWIAGQRDQLSARQQTGVRWLERNLRSRRRRADAGARDRIAKSVRKTRAELRKVGAAGAGKTRARAARTVVQSAIRTSTTVLARQLGEVRSMADREAIHTARIAAKRVRYVLEQFSEELPGADRCINKLQALQTALGEVHDAHVFADLLRSTLAAAGEQRARKANLRLLPWPGAGGPPDDMAPPGSRTGLLALARRLRKEGEDRFEQLRRNWLEGQAAGLVVELGRLTARKTVR